MSLIFLSSYYTLFFACRSPSSSLLNSFLDMTAVLFSPCTLPPSSEDYHEDLLLGCKVMAWYTRNSNPGEYDAVVLVHQGSTLKFTMESNLPRRNWKTAFTSEPFVDQATNHHAGSHDILCDTFSDAATDNFPGSETRSQARFFDGIVSHSTVKDGASYVWSQLVLVAPHRPLWMYTTDLELLRALRVAVKSTYYLSSSTSSKLLTLIYSLRQPTNPYGATVLSLRA